MQLDIQTMGDRIKKERERLGLSQQECASLVQVRREMWAKYESGSEPGARVLAAMAQNEFNVLYILTGQSTYTVDPTATLEVAESESKYASNREEEALLDNYRHSPPDGQAAIRATSAAFAKQTEVKKRGKAA